MTADLLAAAVTQEAANELTSAHQRIIHCVNQLSDEQIWQRSHPSLNSIGNLILHLAGNVRQWLVAGLSGAADHRNRPAEFSERRPIAKQELLRSLEKAVQDATQTMLTLTAEQLLAKRRIQGFDETALSAIFNSVPHFRGHTQEIIHQTRLLLGDSYQFAWQPQSPEQGAP